MMQTLDCVMRAPVLDAFDTNRICLWMNPIGQAVDGPQAQPAVSAAGGAV